MRSAAPVPGITGSFKKEWPPTLTPSARCLPSNSIARKTSGGSSIPITPIPRREHDAVSARPSGGAAGVAAAHLHGHWRRRTLATRLAVLDLVDSARLLGRGLFDRAALASANRTVAQAGTA